MKTDEHVSSTGFDESRSLSIERAQIAEVLIHERRRHQRIRAGFESRSAYVSQPKVPVHVASPGTLEHLWGQVNAVDFLNSVSSKPLARAACSAPEIGYSLNFVPAHGADLLEQQEVHVFLDGILIGGRPLAVTLANR